MAKRVEVTLECKVTLGMFSTERGIVVELPDGRRISALVDRRDVIAREDPRPGREVPGRVKVSVVEREKDSALVDLPQPAFNAGVRLRVPAKLLA